MKHTHLFIYLQIKAFIIQIQHFYENRSYLSKQNLSPRRGTENIKSIKRMTLSSFLKNYQTALSILFCDNIRLKCINMHVTARLRSMSPRRVSSASLYLRELATRHWFLSARRELQLCLPHGRRDQRRPVWLWFPLLPPSPLLLLPRVRLLFHLPPLGFLFPRDLSSSPSLTGCLQPKNYRLRQDRPPSSSRAYFFVRGASRTRQIHGHDDTVNVCTYVENRLGIVISSSFQDPNYQVFVSEVPSWAVNLFTRVFLNSRVKWLCDFHVKSIWSKSNLYYTPLVRKFTCVFLYSLDNLYEIEKDERIYYIFFSLNILSSLGQLRLFSSNLKIVFIVKI